MPALAIPVIVGLGSLGAATAGVVGITAAATSATALAIGGAVAGAVVGGVRAAVLGEDILQGVGMGALIGGTVGYGLHGAAGAGLLGEEAATAAGAETAASAGSASLGSLGEGSLGSKEAIAGLDAIGKTASPLAPTATGVTGTVAETATPTLNTTLGLAKPASAVESGLLDAPIADVATKSITPTLASTGTKATSLYGDLAKYEAVKGVANAGIGLLSQPEEKKRQVYRPRGAY